MARQIAVSTDVYAQIWSMREIGEETEDQILRRVLGCPSAEIFTPRIESYGYRDPRTGTVFPHGFEIFRTYKGTEFKAHAVDGAWKLLNDGSSHSSLNELSNHIIDGNENAWVNWNYLNDDRRASKISSLRDSVPVRRRKDKPMTVIRSSDADSDVIWRDDVVSALTRLGGEAHLDDIYTEVAEIRNARGATLPPSYQAIVRREIEYNSSDSASYQGRLDLFFSVHGIGEGVWALRG